jgi:hypothetical protein
MASCHIPGGETYIWKGRKMVKKQKKQMRLATYLIQKKLLTVEQAKEVLSEQQGQQGKRIHDMFGRLAVKKGYITESALNKAIVEKDREESGLGL